MYLNKPIYTCNVDELLENCCVLTDGRESIGKPLAFYLRVSGGTWKRKWLRNYPTSRKVEG
jgi:hypothetical protein